MEWRDFLSYPERSEPGPALFLIHPKGGLGEYISNRNAKVRQAWLYHFRDQRLRTTGLSGANPYCHGFADSAENADPEFTRVLTEGWRFLLKQATVNKDRVAVCGYCMGGRIAIHFVAATPDARFRRLLSDGARRARLAAPAGAPNGQRTEDSAVLRLISMALMMSLTVLPGRSKRAAAFKENGQPRVALFPFGGHGYVDPGAPGV